MSPFTVHIVLILQRKPRTTGTKPAYYRCRRPHLLAWGAIENGELRVILLVLLVRSLLANFSVVKSYYGNCAASPVFKCAAWGAVGIKVVFDGIRVSVQAFSLNVYKLRFRRFTNCTVSPHGGLSVTKGKYLITVLKWRRSSYCGISCAVLILN